MQVLTGYLRNIDSHFAPFYPREAKDIVAAYATVSFQLFRIFTYNSMSYIDLEFVSRMLEPKPWKYSKGSIKKHL